MVKSVQIRTDRLGKLVTVVYTKSHVAALLRSAAASRRLSGQQSWQEGNSWHYSINRVQNAP